MTFIEKARRIANDTRFKEKIGDALEDAANAFLGNPVSAAKFIKFLLESPIMIRERLFWNKFSLFLEEIYSDENNKVKMIAKFSEDGHREENAERIIACIDKAETKQKVNFLINATRCLLAEFITLQEYFRICSIVTSTLYEDLDFLRKNISTEKFDYSYYIQGLLNSGLMYQSVIDSNTGNHKYSFTALAKLIDEYAISYDNVDRYPNPKCRKREVISPQVDLRPHTASDEDVQQMLNDIFDK